MKLRNILKFFLLAVFGSFLVVNITFAASSNLGKLRCRGAAPPRIHCGYGFIGANVGQTCTLKKLDKDIIEGKCEWASGTFQVKGYKGLKARFDVAKIGDYSPTSGWECVPN